MIRSEIRVNYRRNHKLPVLLSIPSHFNLRRDERHQDSGTMNTEQLSKLIRNSKCLNETLIDITAINVLPTVRIRPFPQLYIINTDPFPNPGKHWVCVVFYNASKADYFASLGKHPEAYSRNLKRFIIENSSNKCTFIPKQIQSNSSDICGLYVVFFAMMRICFHIPTDNVYDMVFFLKMFM